MLVMAACGQSVRLALLGLALLGAAAFAYAGDTKRKPDTGPPPAIRIEVESLGFVAPSRAYLSFRYSTTTLDFIDNDSLLFTFRDAGLMRRVPGDPTGDEDQVIRAVVLDIKTGKPVEQAQWRMHDRQRYLWPLRNGVFMVRQRNSLFLTDKRLELRPYLQFDTPLQAIEVAPDRRLMVIEVQKLLPPDADEGNSSTADSFLGISPQSHRKRTEVFVLRPGDDKVLAQSEARSSVDLPLLTDGFLSLLEGRDPGKWIIRKQTLHSDPETMAEFKSSCLPTLFTVSDAVTLAIGCPPKGGGDHMVSALSSTGQVLWQDRWKQRYIWPTFDYAEDGSRFAFGSLELNREIGFMDYFGADDVTAQMVGVFDTRSGKLELTKDASPVVSAGHNYALSRDGRRFAILREGAIEIYDLPAVALNPVASSAAAADSALAK
jgi:hypothetical protein